jgi:hypothetical protein
MRVYFSGTVFKNKKTGKIFIHPVVFVAKNKTEAYNECMKDVAKYLSVSEMSLLDNKVEEITEEIRKINQLL